MRPYHLFADAVKANPELTFAEAWFDFEAWERSRAFSDDPSAASQATLDWVRDLYGLLVALDDYKGPEVVHCKQALEATFVAFSRLDHSAEICGAVRHWREFRRRELADDEAIASALSEPEKTDS